MFIPPSLSLNGCGIKYSGPERKIGEVCRNVEQLDLASNNFRSFEEILKIIKQMPKLRFLNLSENDLSQNNKRYLYRSHDPKPNRLGNMTSLVLNNTKVPFSIVHLLLDSMPKLCDLHLSLNNYSKLDVGPKKYKNIRRLYISGNPNLKSWKEISNLLRAFPSLKSLSMADCSVDTIPDNLGNILPDLQTLNISNWPIKDWKFIEKLNKLSNLTELRCQGIQVLQTINNAESKRLHLIARLPNIRRLNGSEISKDERLFAEKSFVRWFLLNSDVSKPERFSLLSNLNRQKPNLSVRIGLEVVSSPFPLSEAGQKDG